MKRICVLVVSFWFLWTVAVVAQAEDIPQFLLCHPAGLCTSHITPHQPRTASLLYIICKAN